MMYEKSLVFVNFSTMIHVILFSYECDISNYMAIGVDKLHQGDIFPHITTRSNCIKVLLILIIDGPINKEADI
jgi:hypothetical protein